MPSVLYTATRALFDAGAGDSVEYTLPVRYAGIGESKQVFGTTRRSLAGVRETYYEDSERTYSIQTIPLDQDQWRRLKQFLDSVEAGELFQFSPDGTTAYSSAYLDPPGYDVSRQPERDSLRTTFFSIVVP